MAYGARQINFGLSVWDNNGIYYEKSSKYLWRLIFTKGSLLDEFCWAIQLNFHCVFDHPYQNHKSSHSILLFHKTHIPNAIKNFPSKLRFEFDWQTWKQVPNSIKHQTFRFDLVTQFTKFRWHKWNPIYIKIILLIIEKVWAEIVCCYCLGVYFCIKIQI